jgi:hypothetical protein
LTSWNDFSISVSLCSCGKRYFTGSMSGSTQVWLDKAACPSEPSEPRFKDVVDETVSGLSQL